MAFVWNEELNTGIEKVDEQHYKLFETLDKLENANMQSEAIYEVLIDLQIYISEHLWEEEMYMQSFNYPYLDEHKKLHEQFMKRYQNLLVEVGKARDISKVAQSINHVLSDWITTHYQEADVEMAQFLRKRMKKTA